MAWPVCPGGIVNGFQVTTFDLTTAVRVEGNGETDTITVLAEPATDIGAQFIRIDFTSVDGRDITITADNAPAGSSPNLFGDLRLGIGETGGDRLISTGPMDVTATPNLNVGFDQATGSVPIANGLGPNAFDSVNGFPPVELEFTDNTPGSIVSLYVVFDGLADVPLAALQFNVSSVPVPAGLVLMLTALGGLGFMSRFRSNAATA